MVGIFVRLHLRLSRCLFACLFGCLAAPSAANTLWVDDDAPADPGHRDTSISDPLEDGTAEHPFDAIQEALDASVDGDIILVRDGFYRGDGNRDIDFGGKKVSLSSTGGPGSCIIYCDGTDADPHRAFCFTRGEGADSSTAGFTIAGASAPLLGGAICCFSSSPVIANCRIIGNRAADPQAYCGGIYCSSSSAAIVGCRIEASSAKKGGDAIYCVDSPITVDSCTLTGNQGRAIFSFYAAPALTNCIITGNGRAIRCEEASSASLINCTLAANIHENISCSGSAVELLSTILWSDAVGEAHISITNSFAGPGTVVARYSDVAGGASAAVAEEGCTFDFDASNVDAAPLFIDADAGVYHLSAASPCVDAGDPNYSPSEEATDAAGNPRLADGDLDGQTAVDMGAYEYFSGADSTPPEVDAGPDVLVVLDSPGSTTVTLRGSAVDDSGCDPDLSWFQGEVPLGSGAEIAHSFLTGRHTIELRATDGSGNVGRDSVVVMISYQIYVDDDAPADPGPGDPSISDPLEDGSPAHPYDSIRKAVDAALDAATIIVRDGIYPEVYSISTNKPLHVRSENGPEQCILDGGGLTLYSAATGTVIEGLTIRNCSALWQSAIYCRCSATIVDCHIQDAYYGIRCIDASVDIKDCTVANASRGILSENCDLTIASSTIYGCVDLDCIRSTGSSILMTDCSITDGGGIDASDTVLTVIRSTITSNTATSGGGLYCNGGSAVLAGCTISQNTSAWDGGGIKVNGSPLTLSDCVVSSNEAGDYGGGIYQRNYSPAMLIDCLVTSNTAGKGGAGVSSDSETTIIGSTLADNSTAEGNGGGIRSSYMLTMTDSTIAANSAAQGGGIYFAYGVLSITGCAVTGNSASTYSGGGIYCRSGSPSEMSRCRITDNRAVNSSGGGVYWTGGSAAIANCFIAENAALKGGVYCDFPSDAPAECRITNCTLAGNAAGAGAGVGCYRDSAIITNCIFQDVGPEVSDCAATYSFARGNMSGDGNIRGLPHFRDPANGDYSILPWSPCVNAGSNGAVVGETDLGGNPRIRHGRVDIGAYESPASASVDLDNDGLPDTWEKHFFGDLAAGPHDDNDGDGRSNLREYELATSPAGPIVYVSAANAGDPIADGTIEHPFASIQSAIDTGAGTIRVAGGVGVYSGNVDMTYVNGIIEGGYSPDFSLRAPATFTTVISGDGTAPAVTLRHCYGTVIDGFVITGGATGIYCYYSSPTVSNCVITGNSSEQSGGGLICTAMSDPHIAACSIVGNSSQADGGGICCEAGSSPTIESCLLARNSARQEGGAIACHDSSPKIVNCTIAGNTAQQYGGIYCNEDATPAITNCILWNQGAELASCSATFSVIEGGATGEGNIATSPYFIDRDNDDYRLMPWSTCIDAGSDAAVAWMEDVGGNPRIENAAVDIGAYEFHGQPSGDADNDGLPDLWEQHHFGNTEANPDEDADGDHVSNIREYELGTDPAHAAVAYVDAANTADPDADGTIDHPFPTLGQALDAGAEAILVAGGVYPENLSIQNRSVTIQGGYDREFSARNLPGNETIVGGDNIASVISLRDAHSCVLDGFTITGDADGISLVSSSVTVVDCTLAENAGNGIYGDCYSSVLLINSTLSSNGQSGVQCQYSSLALVDSTIEGNGYGGVFCEKFSSVTITGCTISYNVGVYGVGIHSQLCPLTVTDSFVTDNIGSGHGGALCCDLSNTVIIRSLITRNESVGRSVINEQGGSMTLLDSAIIDNTGGGIWIEIASFSGVNCTIAGNTWSGSPVGGVHCGSRSLASFTNCILWDCCFDTESCLITSSCVQGGASGNSNISMYPYFRDSDNSDYHLLPWSPCINAGDNAATTGDVDLDSAPRVTGGTVDMGAYESQTPASPDEDEDGLPDEWEEYYFNDTAAQPHADSDGDHLTNRQEYEMGTDPVGTMVCYVSAANTDDPEADGSREHPFSTINQALDAGADAIFVAGGEYVESISIGPDFVLLEGGYNTDFLKRDPAQNETIIRSDGTVPVVDIQNNVLCSIEGFTFTGGNGGIRLTASSPTISNCIVTNNIAEGDGGGIQCSMVSNPVITHCTIAGNVAAGNGGGVACNSYSSPKLSNCTISSNSADYGSGIYCHCSSFAMANCTIYDNTSTDTGHGGAVYCSYASVTMTNTEVINNVTGGTAGGIRCIGSLGFYPSITLTDCMVVGNTGRSAGGIYCSDYDCVECIDCSILDNIATDSYGTGGAGIECSAIMTGCTINGNQGGRYGGLAWGIGYSYSTALVVDDCTVAGNYGGGVYCSVGESDTAAFTNSRIAGNTSEGNGAGIYCYGSRSTISLSGLHISENVSGGNGGGAYLSDNVEMQACVISDNSAAGDGGGVYCTNFSPMIAGCTVSRNAATSGGGIACYGGGANLSGCIVSGNTSASTGAGVSYDSIGAGRPTIENCVVVGNSAGAEGDGISCAKAGSNIMIRNCILWENGNELRNCFASYSCIQGGGAGEGNIDRNPVFALPGRWDDNGTPDDTSDDVWIDGDYHLRSRFGRWYPAANYGIGGWVSDKMTSPCIDAGDPSCDYSSEPMPNFGRINIGAYGNTPEASKSGWNIFADANDDCTVNILDLLWVRNRMLNDPATGDNWKADVNNDGKINILDLLAVRNNLMATCEE